ncbi:hypothetical protein BH10PAT1_BH10PAT1_5210 [soil metagenome]
MSLFIENEFGRDLVLNLAEKISPQTLRDLRTSSAESPRPPEFLARGADSIVFKSNDMAVKFYVGFTHSDEERSQRMLESYVYITNKLDEHTRLNPHTVSDLDKKLRIYVNPITTLIYLDSHKCFATVSPYISGNHITDTNRYGIESIANKWQKSMHIYGIHVLSCNIKNRSSINELVITDLCASISMLRTHVNRSY